MLCLPIYPALTDGMLDRIVGIIAGSLDVMKLAIMQPYLFPYIGYFQLAAEVDKFVFYDDVNFIKNGWINRNRMVLGDQVRYSHRTAQRCESFAED